VSKIAAQRIARKQVVFDKEYDKIIYIKMFVMMYNINISFGRKRFEQITADYDLSDLSQAKQVFETELQQYMNGEAQRDDLTVVGFKL
jgi:hypothetical protein